MSYIVLARKYRPQTFEEVYAQEHITTILSNAIKHNRLAHAFLFTGSRGVGKTSMARILAKSLNCMEGLSPTPCNKCENCVEITQGNSTDVVEIDGASNTGVEDIRDLQKELMYSTSKSRYKIFIIDEVHMLSKNAFNALLKTLEEPPERVMFIFATTEPHKVLPTIISRCQRYDFKRIPIDAIVDRLQSICVSEEIKIEDEALYLVAKKAEGSLRDALSLMDQLIAVGKQDIKTGDVLSIFGIVSTDIYHRITECIYKKEAAPIITLIHDILDKGNDLQEFINGYLDYLRNLLLIKTEVPLPELPPSLHKEMEKNNEHFNEDSLLYLLAILIKTKSDIKFAGNPVLIIEMTFIKLTRLEKMIEVSQAIKELRGGTPNPVKQNRPPVTKKTDSEAIQSDIKAKMAKEIKEELPTYTELNEDIFNETREKLIKRLNNAMPIVSDFFTGLTLVKVKNNVLHLKTNSQSAFDFLSKNRDKISKVISEFYRLPTGLNFSYEETEPKQEEKVIKNPTLDDLRKNTPQMAKFIEMTDATVRPLYDYKPKKKEPEPQK